MLRIPRVDDLVWTRDFWGLSTPPSQEESIVPCGEVQKLLHLINNARVDVNGVSLERGQAEIAVPIERIVTGHTPQATGQVTARCPAFGSGSLLSRWSTEALEQPLLIDIDVGLTSYAYNYGAAWLQIVTTLPSSAAPIPSSTPSRGTLNYGKMNYSTDGSQRRTVPLVRSPMGGFDGAEVWLLVWGRRGLGGSRAGLTHAMPEKLGLTHATVELLAGAFKNWFKDVVGREAALASSLPLHSWGKDMVKTPHPLKPVSEALLKNGFHWLVL